MLANNPQPKRFQRHRSVSLRTPKEKEQRRSKSAESKIIFVLDNQIEIINRKNIAALSKIFKDLYLEQRILANMLKKKGRILLKHAVIIYCILMSIVSFIYVYGIYAIANKMTNHPLVTKISLLIFGLAIFFASIAIGISYYTNFMNKSDYAEKRSIAFAEENNEGIIPGYDARMPQTWSQWFKYLLSPVTVRSRIIIWASTALMIFLFSVVQYVCYQGLDGILSPIEESLNISLLVARIIIPIVTASASYVIMAITCHTINRRVWAKHNTNIKKTLRVNDVQQCNNELFKDISFTDNFKNNNPKQQQKKKLTNTRKSASNLFNKSATNKDKDYLEKKIKQSNAELSDITNQPASTKIDIKREKLLRSWCENLYAQNSIIERKIIQKSLTEAQHCILYSLLNAILGFFYTNGLQSITSSATTHKQLVKVLLWSFFAILVIPSVGAGIAYYVQFVEKVNYRKKITDNQNNNEPKGWKRYFKYIIMPQPIKCRLIIIPSCIGITIPFIAVQYICYVGIDSILSVLYPNIDSSLLFIKIPLVIITVIASTIIVAMICNVICRSVWKVFNVGTNNESPILKLTTEENKIIEQMQYSILSHNSENDTKINNTEVIDNNRDECDAKVVFEDNYQDIQIHNNRPKGIQTTTVAENVCQEIKR